MNLMLATLTAKDRFDAFQADADAERLVAPVTTRRAGGSRRATWSSPSAAICG